MLHLNKMTLVQLEYIVAVDTYKSFVAAAEKCFVTQPTLSMQIQKLEDSLGVKIFDRRRQPVVPTSIGEKVIQQARIVLFENQKILELLKEENDDLSGDLRIGVIPTVAPSLLPQVIAAFLEKYPKLKLHIWEYTTERIIQEIKDGRLDCGLLSTPLHDAAIHEIPLYYESFVGYVSEKSDLYQKKMLKADDLHEERLWLLNEGHCMRGQVLNICHHRHNQMENGTFEYNTGSVETLKRMVDTSGGMTILPELSVFHYTEDELQNIRYFKAPEPVREVSLVTAQHFAKRKALHLLKDEIVAKIPDRFLTKDKKNVVGFQQTL